MIKDEMDLSSINQLTEEDFFNNSNEIPDITLNEAHENLKVMGFDEFEFLNTSEGLEQISAELASYSDLGSSTHDDSMDNLLSNSNEDMDHIEFTSENYEAFEMDQIQKSFRSTKKHGKVEIGYLNNEDLDHGKPGQKLFLTTEEKSLLVKSGHKIPTHIPLTKIEDKALRTVRRKIRNKLSAKASRARRQKYLCGIEDQLNNCSQENVDLKKKIFQLEQDKKSLISYVRRLRNFISSYIPEGISSVSKLANVGKRTLQKSVENPSLLPFYHKNAPKSLSKSYAKPAAGGTSLLVAVFIILAWTAVVPSSEETKIIPNEEISNSMPSRILLSTSHNSVIGPQPESFYNNQAKTKGNLNNSENTSRPKINHTHQQNKRNSFNHIRVDSDLQNVRAEVLVSG